MKNQETVRRSRLDTDRKNLTFQTHRYNNLLGQAKSDYYTEMITENQNNPKKLWNCMNRILHRSDPSPLPDCSDKSILANNFGTFFSDKIAKIRAVLNSTYCSGEHIKPTHIPPKLLSFNPISEEEMRKLISSSPTKSCDIDPCPTSLVKE